MDEETGAAGEYASARKLVQRAAKRCRRSAIAAAPDQPEPEPEPEPELQQEELVVPTRFFYHNNELMQVVGVEDGQATVQPMEDTTRDPIILPCVTVEEDMRAEHNMQ